MGGKMSKKIFSALLALSFTTDAFAYIDPGTGAFLVQSLIALFVSILFYLRHPIQFVKMIYRKIFPRKSDE
jgi:hypothetical protein